MHPARSAFIAVSLGSVLVAGVPPAPARIAPIGYPVAFLVRPLAFEANAGQTDPRVRFLARGAGGTAFVTDTETVLAAPAGALRIRPVSGAAPAAEGLVELPGRANYFLGNDPSKWHSNIPTFARVRHANVWPGIDLVWHASDAGRLEYDFVVAPGADPALIAVDFDGACSLAIDADGDLTIGVGDGVVVQRRPVVYQAGPHGREPVAGNYVLESDRRVSFAVGAYDRTLPLVLDPVIEYQTYLGGNGRDSPYDALRDDQGNLYIVGSTSSSDFPVAAAFDATFAGAAPFRETDGFITKLDPSGSALIFSTYVGAAGDDIFSTLTLDQSGNIWTGGATHSPAFPTTPGAIQSALNGPSDAMLCKFSGDGATLLASTFVGGSDHDGLNDIELDSGGNVYAVGCGSPGLVTTPGAFQTTHHGGVLDAFVVKLAPDLKSRGFSTYLGGSGQDDGVGLALGPGNDVFVVGYTSSTNYPVANAAQSVFGGGSLDGFVARLNSSASQLVWSTYVGGPGLDALRGIEVDSAGGVVVSGGCGSGLIGVTNAFQGTYGGGDGDGLVGSYAADGTKTSLSYIGGSGYDSAGLLVRDADGSLWIGGETQSADFPVVDAEQPALGGDADAWVARLDAAASVVEHASYYGGTKGDFPAALVPVEDHSPILVGITRSGGLPTNRSALLRHHSGGDTDGFVATTFERPPLSSYFLPKEVVAKANTADPSKSTLHATGIFDTGPDAPDFAGAATLDVGGLRFVVPGLTPDGDGFTFKGNGVEFTIEPNPYGSSRAKFVLKYTGDLRGKVEQNGPLSLYFTNAVTDGGATVILDKGKFGLGDVQGALERPNLFVVRARADLKGPGRDALSLVVGLATAGKTPSGASDFSVQFGAGLSATIPAAKFKKKGSVYTFTGNVAGVTKVVIDYSREQISVTGKKLTLGTFAQGGNPVTIGVALGPDARTVNVRMGRIGNTMKY